jgi:hypothetical protein
LYRRERRWRREDRADFVQFCAACQVDRWRAGGSQRRLAGHRIIPTNGQLPSWVARSGPRRGSSWPRSSA